jgi:hypothetical protein
VGGPVRRGGSGAGGVSGIGPPGDGLVPPPLYGGVSGVVLGGLVEVVGVLVLIPSVSRRYCEYKPGVFGRPFNH